MDNLILNAGGRYDYFSFFGDTLDRGRRSSTSPGPIPSSKPSTARRFRAPNAYEMYCVSTGYASNTRLEPETIRSYELVFEQTIIPQVRKSSPRRGGDFSKSIYIDKGSDDGVAQDMPVITASGIVA